MDHAPLLERAFQALADEHAAVRVPVHGSLPAYVRGTCYLNGPGRFARGRVQYRHWLDGDGMVCALGVAADGCTLTNRFVRSEKFVREEAEGRAIFRTFGTSFAGDELKRGIGLVSPVNVSVYPYKGTLLAFGEQGLPWEVEPQTLDTRGLFTFNGQLNEITPFSAHPKIDYHSGEFFNFGVSFSADNPALNVFRIAPDGRLAYRRRVRLPYASSMHDFAISGRYLVFYVSPLVLSMARLLQGCTLMDSLTWQPALGSHLLVVSRDTGELVASLDAGRMHCLHLVNAFDQDRGRLVVDLIEFEKPLYPEYQIVPNLFTDTFRGHPVRLVVDVDARRIVERVDIGYDCSPDFPQHDQDLTGRPYDQFWMLGISRAGQPGRKFFDELVRVNWGTRDVDVYRAPARHYLGGEPIFVPDPSQPRSGVVMCQVFDAETSASSFAAFDAFNVAAGPIATIAMPSVVPFLFHSVFAAAS
ncbi:MAG TPA: carotenoid oxygenase family protein [Vicinamibacterales bacterium]